MGRKRKYETPEEMENAIDDFFLLEKIPTTSGLALHLGFADRQSLRDYQEREGFSCVIKKAITRIEIHHETRLTTENKPTGSIFWLKNHGWSDKSETEGKSEVVLKLGKDEKKILTDFTGALLGGKYGEAAAS